MTWCMLCESDVGTGVDKTQICDGAYYNAPLVGLTGRRAGSYENAGFVTLETVGQWSSP